MCACAQSLASLRNPRNADAEQRRGHVFPDGWARDWDAGAVRRRQAQQDSPRDALEGAGRPASGAAPPSPCAHFTPFVRQWPLRHGRPARPWHGARSGAGAALLAGVLVNPTRGGLSPSCPKCWKNPFRRGAQGLSSCGRPRGHLAARRVWARQGPEGTPHAACTGAGAGWPEGTWC